MFGMKLVDNWKRILRHAWSLRLNLLVILTSGADAAGAYIADGKIGASLGVFALSVAASGARLVAQEKVSADE